MSSLRPRFLKLPCVRIPERLDCLDAEEIGKIAPTIPKGPYADEIAAGDHISLRPVWPELDNGLFNLEFMLLTLN